MQTFWMVYVEGGGAPVFQHTTEKSAEQEAERLAEKTGRRVFVLKATACCEQRRVQWVPCIEESPF